MTTALLGRVAEINPRLKVRPPLDEIVSFVPMAALDAESGTTSRGEQRVYGEVQKGYTIFRDQDILVAKITPCFENGKIGTADLSHPVGVGSTEFHVVRPDPALLDRRYALHFLRQARIRLDGERRMTGSAGQRRVPAAYLAELQIRVPPLEEQRRVAAILDQADAIRAKQLEAVTLVTSLTESVFLEMFGDPSQGISQGDWDIMKVGDIADVQGGLTVNSSRKVNPIEVPYLRVANVHRERLDLSEVKTLHVSQSEIERTKLQDSDLLVVEGHGNPAEIGRAALWNSSIETCVHQNHLIRVRFNAGIVLPAFASAYINSRSGRRHLLRAGKTTSGLNTISVSDVRATPIATPPITLQKRFVERLDTIHSFKDSQMRSVGHLDKLFAAVQSLAFAGGL